jgi:alginate O-acetyltransferase complex protein AlgI
MLFSSITFLYYFLPLVIILYYLVPFRYKNLLLVISSIIFYAWGEPIYCILMLLSVLQGYMIGLRIEAVRGTPREKQWLVLSIIISLSILGFFKYYNFFIINVQELTHLPLPLLSIALPLGISFYTFQIMSYTIDVYRGMVKAERNLLDFTAYAILFPQLVAGPIIIYADISQQLHKRTHNMSGAYLGSRRFLVGLGKKVLFANSFGMLCSQFDASKDRSVLFYWLYAIAYTLQIYYDFSGYSDMAIGLGKIFGFDFTENFNYPYISKSITEFWRRWHISLSTWFRDYVYIPLGGNRVSRPRQILNLLIVWMLTGLWHGAGWNFVFWGLFFALLLILEKFVLFQWKWYGKGFIAHCYIMPLIIMSFVLFRAESLKQAVFDMKALLGMAGVPVFSVEAWYYLRSYGILMLMGAIGATPVIKNCLYKIIETKVGERVAVILEPALLAALLLIVTGYLVDGSFNPFLYFRF